MTSVLRRDGEKTHREEGHLKAELEGCSRKPENARNHQKLEEAKDRPLEPSEGVWPSPYLDFRLLASRTESK